MFKRKANTAPCIFKTNLRRSSTNIQLDLVRNAPCIFMYFPKAIYRDALPILNYIPGQNIFEQINKYMSGSSPLTL